MNFHVPANISVWRTTVKIPHGDPDAAGPVRTGQWERVFSVRKVSYEGVIGSREDYTYFRLPPEASPYTAFAVRTDEVERTA